ncbi:MAG: NAD(P)H-hydrate dehydratase, partial [Acidobacteriota bacterium]|nr:NAD(P)H-hydrate dehydratase [Acidobacteriota bacterium]
LVTVATPKSCVPDISQTPELMTLGLPDRHGKVAARGADAVLALKSDVVAVGPGFGTALGAAKLVLQLLDKYDGPLILDADALNVLDFEDVAIQKAFVRRAVRAYKTDQRYAVIMTPHVAEFSRLTGRTVDEINADPISISSKFARKWGVWLVLKGTRTILAKPTGHTVINTTGNPGMATAGCGDVLTGVIAACLAKKEVESRHHSDTAQTAEWIDAISFGGEYTLGVLEAIYIHGRAGDLAARARGEVSLIASDILDCLGEAFTSVTEKSYPSERSNSRYVTQVTRRNRGTSSHEALVSVPGFFYGCADLATKFFGFDAETTDDSLDFLDIDD